MIRSLSPADLSFVLVLLGETASPPYAVACTDDPVLALATFLESNPKASADTIGSQPFSKQAIDREQASRASTLIRKHHADRIRAERADEWKAKAVTCPRSGRTLRFEVRAFGKDGESDAKAAGGQGRPLFISMHGGGGVPAHVNDQQWRNQVRLYNPGEGVYIAPRAPTDTWNLWHEAHIDGLFDRLIECAIVFEGVDPDRVYLMGYSAGGDGVFQLAPRMADRFAAAAMMAGHPNDASPVNLRNLPFSIQCGADDQAYGRSKVCREWGERLEALRADDPGGYEHQCVIYEGLGHWMNGKDAQAVNWMLAHTRNPLPRRVVWRQDDVLSPRLYWLMLPESERKPAAEVRASIDGQTITLTSESVRAVTLLLADELVDMDRPVRVVFNGQEFVLDRPTRSIRDLALSLDDRPDPRLIFPGRVTIALSPGR